MKKEPTPNEYVIESKKQFTDGFIEPKKIFKDFLYAKSAHEAYKLWQKDQRKSWHLKYFSKIFIRFRLTNGRIVNIKHVFSEHGNSVGPKNIAKKKRDKRFKENMPKFLTLKDDLDIKAEFKSRRKMLAELNRLHKANRLKRSLIIKSLKNAIILDKAKFSLIK